MTGSMYASIAGLKTHMQKLSVIGNNIANVNTQGYKTQRTVFRDSIYRNYKSGSDGTSTVGGMNPSQLGYGSIIGSIDIDMSSSSYNPGNSMDCALVGDGFFLVGSKEVAQAINPNNPDSFKSLTLTRVGDFHFDADGYLVDGDGNCVYGFMNTNTHEGDAKDAWTGDQKTPAENNGYKVLANGKTVPNISDQLVPIRKPYWEKVEVPAVVEDGKVVTPATSKYIIHYAQTPKQNNAGGGAGGAGTDNVVGPLTDDKQPAFVDNTQGGTVRELEVADLNSISIDAGTGAITGFVKGTDELITIGYIAIGSVSNPNGVSHAGDSYYKCQAGAGDLNITMLGGVQNDLGINYVNGSTVARANQNQGGGNQGGTTSTVRDDLPRGSEIISTGNTKMMTGFLEAPNVDLATEISELITTQRGYQANTRIITVTDSMLEELVNMKR